MTTIFSRFAVVHMLLLAFLYCYPAVAQMPDKPANTTLAEQVYAVTLLAPKNAPVPPLLLHHVEIMLDSATYNAVKQSDFWRTEFGAHPAKTFATAEERTTPQVAPQAFEWLSFKVFGQDTYAQLHNRDAMYALPIPPNTKDSRAVQTVAPPEPKPFSQIFPERSHLVFGIEQEGGSAALLHALQSTDSAYTSSTASVLCPRRVGLAATKVQSPEQANTLPTSPWQYITTTRYLGQAERRFKAHVVEYHPAYQRAANPNCPPVEDGITRRQHLVRDYAPAKLLQNITSVCVALDSIEAHGLVRLLKASAYTVKEGKREIKATLHTSNHEPFHLRIVRATASRQGIIELRMKLHHHVPHHITTFGENSTLMLDGEEAVWTF
ncbi:MAG: hypothetical protein EAZ92_05520 [Candidatus Kapaibacterium sp.]|nr:MAG: hypothetical protein EAZ92_05520 [Candidatus Kapabacteria bacterium]